MSERVIICRACRVFSWSSPENFEKYHTDLLTLAGPVLSELDEIAHAYVAGIIPPMPNNPRKLEVRYDADGEPSGRPTAPSP